MASGVWHGGDAGHSGKWKATPQQGRQGMVSETLVEFWSRLYEYVLENLAAVVVSPTCATLDTFASKTAVSCH
jgi:hypothetical protein